MRNVGILFLACLISDCYGDFINNALLKVLATKGIVQGISGDNSVRIINQGKQSKYISNSLYNNQKNMTKKNVRLIPVLKRNDVFPKERIKTIDISKDGQKIAYLIEEGKKRYVKIVPSQNKNLMSQVIRENYPINNFAFIGKNVLYTYFDEDNNLKAKVHVSLSGKKQLELPENLQSIRLFKGDKAFLAECYDGESYFLYKINMNNLSCSEPKELSGPILSLFDKNLNPILIVKNENELINVYVEPIKKEVSTNAEEEVDMEGEDLLQVDQIDNPSLSKYFSVDNEKNCYKISIRKPQNLLLIEQINPMKGTKQEIYKLKGVSNLSQCKVNIEPNGKPSFVTINSRRYQHYGWDSQIKGHITIINNHFSSWYRISTTGDGKIWLICAVNDRSLDKFYLYDTRTHNLKMISNINNSVKNAYLKATECHFVPLSSGEYLQMFLTRGVNSTSKSPLILMLNSNGQYKWEYMPIVQVLANRGCNVLCLNYRKDELTSDSVADFEKSVTKATSDIAEAINWSVKNNIARLGNIVLLAKKHSVIPAMQMFLKNQQIFTGYIGISPSDNDINMINSFGIDKISKPTIYIGRFNKSEAVQSFMEKTPSDVTSIISSNELINQKLMTGIIETFLVKKFSNLMVENLAQTDVNSLDVFQDGLNIIKSSDDSHVYEAEEGQEDITYQYRSL